MKTFHKLGGMTDFKPENENRNCHYRTRNFWCNYVNIKLNFLCFFKLYANAHIYSVSRTGGSNVFIARSFKELTRSTNRSCLAVFLFSGYRVTYFIT